MTISWSGTGGLFSILGAIDCAIRNTNGRRGSTDPNTAATWGSGTGIRCLETEVDNIVAAYSTAQQAYFDGIRTTESSMVSAQSGYISALMDLVKNSTYQLINADNPLPDSNDSTVITELIRQMTAASKTVNRCVLTATVTAGSSNVGNPSVIASVTGRNGLPLEYAFAETVVGKVTSDSDGNGSGTATAGNEPIGFVAPAAISDKFDVLWPGGSGSNTSLNIVDPTSDNSAGNLLTNGDLLSFTANVPDDWSVLVGSAETSILKTTSNTYASAAACLQFVGDGAELTSIAQTFTSSTVTGDTAGQLLPGRVYAVRFMARVSATPGTGVLSLSLVDSTNTVINDDQGTANNVTLALTGISTTFVKCAGFFRTPTNIPATMKLRVRLSTALDSGKTVNIAYGGLTEATQLYTGGPHVAAFRGATDVTFNDVFNVAITNDRAGKFQTFFEQVYGMASLGLILPSSTSPNISDGLII